MANHLSAAKRDRQSKKRAERGRYHRTTMRTYIKRVRTACESKDAKKATDALRMAVRFIDRAARQGVIHVKTASRTISRLTLAVNRLAA